MATKELKLEVLEIDDDLYPRESRDDNNVRSLVESLRAGEHVPPIVVEKGSMRIVDGVHRYYAHKRLERETISAELRSYDSDAEAFAEAMRLNSGHGRKLTTIDQIRCSELGGKHGLSESQIAGSLRIRTEALKKRATGGIAICRGEVIPLKRTLRHLAGAELTDAQVECNKRAAGMPQPFYIRQVITLIESNSLDTGNVKVHEELGVLYRLLQRFVGDESAA